MRAVAAVVTPLVVVGLLLIEPALAVWLDQPELAVAATPVALALLPGVWSNCLAYVPSPMLQGAGRPDLVAKAHVAELVPYLAALAFALTTFGVVGAAVVWSARTTTDLLLLGAFSRVPVRAIVPVFGFAALVVVALAVVVAGLGPVPVTVLGLALIAVASGAGWRQVRPSLPAPFRAG